MRSSRCWVQAKAARAEIAPRAVKARETRKTTAPAPGKPHHVTRKAMKPVKSFL
jgi:hypothetical protein